MSRQPRLNFLTQMAVDSQSAEPNDVIGREAARQAAMRRADERRRLKHAQGKLKQAGIQAARVRTPTPWQRQAGSPSLPNLPANLQRLIHGSLSLRDQASLASTSRGWHPRMNRDRISDANKAMKIFGDAIRDLVRLNLNAHLPHNIGNLNNPITPERRMELRSHVVNIGRRYGWDSGNPAYPQFQGNVLTKIYPTPLGTIAAEYHAATINGFPRWMSMFILFTRNYEVRVEVGGRTDRHTTLSLGQAVDARRFSSPPGMFYTIDRIPDYAVRSHDHTLTLESPQMELRFLKGALAKSGVKSMVNYEMSGTQLNFSSDGIGISRYFGTSPQMRRQ